MSRAPGEAAGHFRLREGDTADFVLPGRHQRTRIGSSHNRLERQQAETYAERNRAGTANRESRDHLTGGIARFNCVPASIGSG